MTDSDFTPKDEILHSQLNMLEDSDHCLVSSRPRKPDHPILHINHDENSFVSCIDLLKRSANFVDLLGYIVVDDEDQRFQREGGLSPGAAWAYRQLVTTVSASVRFATDSLEFNEEEGSDDFSESTCEALEDQPID